MPVLSQWIQTLQAGTYNPITKYLHTPNGFDPLGVLCEMYRLSQAPPDQPEWVLDPTGTFYSFVLPGQPTGMAFKLPETVQLWAGDLAADPILTLTDSTLSPNHPKYVPLNQVVDGVVLKFDPLLTPVFGVTERPYTTAEVIAHLITALGPTSTE